MSSQRHHHRQVELEDSIDIDTDLDADSYPPPHRRSVDQSRSQSQQRYGQPAPSQQHRSKYGNASSSSYSSASVSASYTRNQRAPSGRSASPPPDQFDPDSSNSFSDDYAPRDHQRTSSVSASSAYAAATAAAARAANPPRYDPRRSKLAESSSADDLNPDNEEEYRPYVPAKDYYPNVLHSGNIASSNDTKAKIAAASSAAASAAGRGPQRRKDEDEEEVSIDFDESLPVDTRVSNNTLIHKAQQIQLDQERREAQSSNLKSKPAQPATAAPMSSLQSMALLAASAASSASSASAASDKASAASAVSIEEARIRKIEDEEDEREREEADRAREALRAEIDEDDEYGADNFSTSDAGLVPARKVAAPSSNALSALDDSSGDNDDAAIEIARRQLELQEEQDEKNEADAARRAVDVPDDKLTTAAFTNKSWGLDNGPASVSHASSAVDDASARNLAIKHHHAPVGASSSFNESADLQERQDALEREEEAAEEVEREKRNQAQMKERAAAANAKKAVEVEDTYDDDSMHDEKSHVAPPVVKRPIATTTSMPTVARGSLVRHTSAPTPSSATSTTAAPAAATSSSSSTAAYQLSSIDSPHPSSVGPSILASALATLNPQVSSLVLRAIQDQMSHNDALSNGRPGVNEHYERNAYAAYLGASSIGHGRAVEFNPSQSRDAASEAWEQLMAMKKANGANYQYEPRDGYSQPRSTLPHPPAVPSAQLQSWEQTLAHVASSQLARSNPTHADRLFARRDAPLHDHHHHDYASSYPPRSAPSDPHPYDTPTSRYIHQVLTGGDIASAPAGSRSSLRVDSERDALRRLLAYEPRDARDDDDKRRGVSGPLAQRVDEQKNLYMQDQAVLHSVLKRVLAHGTTAHDAIARSIQHNALELNGADGSRSEHNNRDAHEKMPRRVSEGVSDDGRLLQANDVIRMIDDGYPHAAHGSWQHFNTNTITRSVLLAAEPASELYTRRLVESTMRETIGEMLADDKIVETIKKATLQKLKHRLTYTRK